MQISYICTYEKEIQTNFQVDWYHSAFADMPVPAAGHPDLCAALPEFRGTTGGRSHVVKYGDRLPHR